MNTRGFSLLEVTIALAILSLGLTVLVDTQATSVIMTLETERIRIATMLAQEKMVEVQLDVERMGFGDQDIEEEGDFEDFGEEEFRGDPVGVDLGETFEDYHWAYTVREIELDVIPDMAGAAGDLASSGYWGEDAAQELETDQSPDLTDFVSPDMITDMLGSYIREVRVLVWWGDEPDDADQVELATHVINPSGTIVEGSEETVEEE